jgi:hypothetical protein
MNKKTTTRAQKHVFEIYNKPTNKLPPINNHGLKKNNMTKWLINEVYFSLFLTLLILAAQVLVRYYFY